MSLAAQMEGVIVNELSALGFGPFFEQQLQQSGGDEVIPARIAAEHRGAYEVWSTAGSGRAQLAGRLRLELEDAGAPGVGDWVVVKDAPDPGHTTVIERPFMPEGYFGRLFAIRRPPRRHGGDPGRYV
jgi:hypothetical protein